MTAHGAACRICLSALALMLAVAALPAQQKDKKNRIVFEPGQAQPVATVAPTPAAQPKPAPEPQEVIDSFFSSLKANNSDAAYDELVRGTIIADRKEDVSALKAKTNQALDSYGPVKGFEIIETLEAGKSLMRCTCLSLNEDLPLRWRFYFYRGGGTWKLVDLRVDDGLAELFEDVARSRKK